MNFNAQKRIGLRSDSSADAEMGSAKRKGEAGKEIRHFVCGYKN